MIGFASLLVFLGGGLGAYFRFVMIGRLLPLTAAANMFPLGLLVVNVLGSLLMGLLVGLLMKLQTDTNYAQSGLYLFLGVGLLGGFTTFSSFALDTIILMQRGLHGQMLLYIVLSVVLSLAALLGGFWITRMITGGT